MSRSGYSDEIDDQLEYGRWRGRVASAIRGKRGQAMLRELRDALDALPEKRLVAGVLKDEDGCCCTAGVILDAKGVPDLVNREGDDHDWIAQKLNVAPCVIQEIEWENDEDCYTAETPEQRWVRMREWVERRIQGANP